MLKRLLISGDVVMVTLKELEKQRIEKIKSLSNSQVENYVDVIVKDICKLHDFNSVVNPDERLDDIVDGFYKLNEVSELTGAKFNNINNYIHIKLNNDLTIALTVEIQKYLLKDANSRNAILSFHLKELLINYTNFNMYTALLYELIFDFKEISAVAPTVAGKKESYVDALKIPILLLKDEIEKNVAILDNVFYSDETIAGDIQDLKLTIKNFAESDDDNDKLFVELNLIDVLVGFITAYERHAEIKDIYVKYKAEISDLFDARDNVFKKYSAEKYDVDSGINFNNFMKSEPKFNIDTGELIE